MTVEDPFIQWGTVNVGLGHVQADREAADGMGKQICVQYVVPHRRIKDAAGHGSLPFPALLISPQCRNAR